MKITFCQYNEQSSEVIAIIKDEYPQYEISITRCIYCCGECSSKPIARIKGELLVANTPKALIHKILSYTVTK